jgi:hypothetical protein
MWCVALVREFAREPGRKRRKRTQNTEVAPGFVAKGLSGGVGCSVMVDGADDEENETEVRCRREGEDSA